MLTGVKARRTGTCGLVDASFCLIVHAWLHRNYTYSTPCNPTPSPPLVNLRVSLTHWARCSIVRLVMTNAAHDASGFGERWEETF